MTMRRPRLCPPPTRVALLAAAVALGAAGCGSAHQVVSMRGMPVTTTTASAEHPVPHGPATSTDPNGSAPGDQPGSTPGSGGSGSSGSGGSGGGTNPSGGVDSPPPNDGSTVTSPGGPTGSTPPQQATEVPNHTDLKGGHITVPESVVADPADGTLLHVRFWGGIPACTAAVVTVQESSTEVTVTLRTDGATAKPGMACPDIAEYEQISVHLHAPLAHRHLAITQPR